MADKPGKKSSRINERMVTFEITTLRPLPVGQQVFISGDTDALGHWRADGFPLTRLDDNLWSGYMLAREDQPIEFKITRGGWHNEEADKPGAAREDNHKLPAGGNITFRHIVNSWIDRR